jgi:sugar O-acyltransferase (sialic acid O-acetyltransferase NeuD family)
MMKDIVIIGGGGHAKVIASVLKRHPLWNPIGYLDVVNKGYLLELPYLGMDETLPRIMKDQEVFNAVIGIGQIQNTEDRKKIVRNIESIGISLPAIVSSRALVNEEVKIGDGTVIMDGVIIQPGARIGNYSIINTGATVDHDCHIGNFVHIAPGVNLSGDVKIADSVLVGVSTCVVQNVSISKDVIIAAGSVVVKSILESGTYAGVPARNLCEHFE